MAKPTGTQSFAESKILSKAISRIVRLPKKTAGSTQLGKLGFNADVIKVLKELLAEEVAARKLEVRIAPVKTTTTLDDLAGAISLTQLESKPIVLNAVAAAYSPQSAERDVAIVISRWKNVPTSSIYPQEKLEGKPLHFSLTDKRAMGPILTAYYRQERHMQIDEIRPQDTKDAKIVGDFTTTVLAHNPH